MKSAILIVTTGVVPLPALSRIWPPIPDKVMQQWSQPHCILSSLTGWHRFDHCIGVITLPRRSFRNHPVTRQSSLAGRRFPEQRIWLDCASIPEKLWQKFFMRRECPNFDSIGKSFPFRPRDFPISPLTIVEHGYNESTDDVKLFTFYAFALIWTLSLDYILTVTLVGKVDCFEVFFNIACTNPSLCVDFHLSCDNFSHNLCKNFISYEICNFDGRPPSIHISCRPPQAWPGLVYEPGLVPSPLHRQSRVLTWVLQSSLCWCWGWNNINLI